MSKKCCSAILNGLLFLSFLMFFSCTLPLDPAKNPDVVIATLFTLHTDIIEGESASFGISVSYPMHVDSVTVSFDANRENDTTVYCKTKKEYPETLMVTHTYQKESAAQTVNASVNLTNGNTKKASLVFKVRKKDLKITFVMQPRPRLAAINEPDTLNFITENYSSGKGVIYEKTSMPVLNGNNLQLINKKDTALLVVIPERAEVYKIYCYATYGDAMDTADAFITAYKKPTLTTASGSQTQDVGATDTLLFSIPDDSSGIRYSLLETDAYKPGVLTSLPIKENIIRCVFTPNEIKTYLFSVLVTKDSLTDTITYQRTVRGVQKVGWKQNSERITVNEGKALVFPFASFLTGVHDALSFTTSKGAISRDTLYYPIPWGVPADSIVISANSSGSISSFIVHLNIIPGDSSAPVMQRTKPENDIINTDQVICEFTISDSGAGVGSVTFACESRAIDTSHSGSVYRCTITGLKNNDSIQLMVTATDKSLRKNTRTASINLFIVKVDTAKTLTYFGFSEPLIAGTIDQIKKNIQVTVPYGTDVKSLAAVFITTGASVKVGSSLQESGKTRNDFTDTVRYGVIAADGGANEYNVKVSIASPYEYTVTFDGQNATVEPDPKTIIVKEPAKTVTTLPAEPKKDAHIFGGWFTDKNGVGNQFTCTTVVAQNMTVYAKWNLKEYTVTFDARNGIQPGKKQVLYGNKLTITEEPKRTGYDFKGWFKDTQCTDDWNIGEDKVTGDITLYANWALIIYDITFENLFNGTNIDNLKNYTIETADITLKEASRPGYDFKGWFSETSFQNQVTIIKKGTAGHLTLYARWTPASYTITYILYEGKNHVSNPASYTIENELTLYNAELFGYVFGGWYADENFSRRVENISRGDSGNKNLYAKWIIMDASGNTYTEVKIGSQVWMVENFRSTKYNDGTPIPHVPDSVTWGSLITPGYCFYDNIANFAYQAKWGALYNWYAVSSGKLAPKGWRVPTDADWTTLKDFLIANGYNYDSTTTENKIAKSLAAKTDWASSTGAGMPGNGLMENNKSGFSALPAGYRTYAGDFSSHFYKSSWWTAATSGPDLRGVHYDLKELISYNNEERSGFAVRLVKE